MTGALAGLCAATVWLAGAAGAAAPEVTAVEPAPLTPGATAQILGSGLVVDETAIAIGGQAQSVVFVAPDGSKAVFLVGQDVPLGSQELLVTTPDGQVAVPVEVAPAPPRIETLGPRPLVLGELGTATGSALDTVETVTLDDVSCEITEQTAGLLVFLVPFDGALVGAAQLVVEGPSGFDVEGVEVAAPPPSIDQLAPNPVRQGDLVTVRGRIVASSVGVSVGGWDAPVIRVGDGEVVAQVPPEVPYGARQVVISVDRVESQPAGPLHVEVADPGRPVVTGVHPFNVFAGGAFWATGRHLDGVETAAPDGFSIDACGERGCRVVVDAATTTLGPRWVALTSPAGTAVAHVQISEPQPGFATPTVDGAAPQPAFRGEALTVSGAGLKDIKAVVVGGVVQEIDLVDVDRLEIAALAEDTPLGAEPLFVAGGGTASGAILVTVLAPFDVDTGAPADPGDGSSAPPSDTAGADPGPTPEDGSGREDGTLDTSSPADAALSGGGTTDSGCSAGGSPGGLPWVLLAWILVLLVGRTGPVGPTGPTGPTGQATSRPRR